MIQVPIPQVVLQHVEEAGALRNTRSSLVSAPHVRLHHLRRLDDRLAAHLDGVAVAGEYGAKLAAAALEKPRSGAVFTATVRALEDRNTVALERLLALAEALPDVHRGLLSAFGWVEAASLRGITAKLLQSPVAFPRLLGLASCSMHQADPGAAVDAALGDPDASLRARALRVSADLGRVDLLSACVAAMADGDARCAFEAARAAVWLGDRHTAMAALHRMASEHGPWRSHSLRTVLKLCGPVEANALLKTLSQDPAHTRLLIQGVGTAGDPHYVPWLLHQMQAPELARVAGESFSFITGIDLADLGLERKPPEDFEAGPNDDPDDGDVAMDEDDGLPWPDLERLNAWWSENGHGFKAGARHFMGEPPSPGRCIQVLKNGYQRQRIAAAEYLCLLRPGSRLFPVRAPAWRQQRWLAQMPNA